MNVGSVLKEYRQIYNISQRELAKMLHVSDMTISRLESGNRIRLASESLKVLIGILNDAELNNVNGISDLREWSVYTQLANATSESEVRSFGMECLKEEHALETILSGFEAIGFHEKSCLFNRGGKRGTIDWVKTINLNPWAEYRKAFELILENDVGKIWAVDFAWEFHSIFIPEEVGWISILYEHIGKCCCTKQKMHKYSIITNATGLQRCAIEDSVSAPRLNHDVSIIHYNLFSGRMDSETNLAFFKDGRGVFDLAVEENKQESSMQYANWMMRLNEL